MNTYLVQNIVFIEKKSQKKYMLGVANLQLLI